MQFYLFFQIYYWQLDKKSVWHDQVNNKTTSLYKIDANWI